MRVAIIVNEERATSPQLDHNLIAETAIKYDLSYYLFIVKPEDIETTVTKIIAEAYDAVLIGGGDGTARSVAQLLGDTTIPLAILPLGTFNYFAKELNFPTDIDGMFSMIKKNKHRSVDIGEVNQHVFLNHSSIGFYSRILRLREKHRDILGKNKLLKVLFTAFNCFHALPIYRLKIKMDDKIITVDTALIFIGNNYHFTDLLNFGDRPSLTSGNLAIYILQGESRWEIIRCFFSLLFNTFNKDKYLLQYDTTHLEIEANSKQINVVIDGDLFKLDTPLNYTSNNRKLLVFAADD